MPFGAKGLGEFFKGWSGIKAALGAAGHIASSVESYELGRGAADVQPEGVRG